ncbi:MAG: hypothetical protein HY869_11235 [Chloroflexi bacterium]|nr:hypothetical protein [Chloroflexota bacterium]
MKKPLHILRPSALIILGLLLALVSAALGQPSVFGLQAPTGTPTPQASPTPPALDPSEIGSTNGLVFVGILITIIIIVPILIRWKTWVRKA